MELANIPIQLYPPPPGGGGDPVNTAYFVWVPTYLYRYLNDTNLISDNLIFGKEY